MVFVIIYSMTHVADPILSDSLSERKFKGQITTIQIASHTKDYLNLIKEEAGVETFDQAILFLIKERRKKLSSSFGKLPHIGSFIREEEDDPYRIRN